MLPKTNKTALQRLPISTPRSKCMTFLDLIHLVNFTQAAEHGRGVKRVVALEPGGEHVAAPPLSQRGHGSSRQVELIKASQATFDLCFVMLQSIKSDWSWNSHDHKNEAAFQQTSILPSSFFMIGKNMGLHFMYLVGSTSSVQPAILSFGLTPFTGVSV